MSRVGLFDQTKGSGRHGPHKMWVGPKHGNKPAWARPDSFYISIIYQYEFCTVLRPDPYFIRVVLARCFILIKELGIAYRHDPYCIYA